MSLQPFKQFSITAGGTPQPAVGTTSSAPVYAPTNPAFGTGQYPEPAAISIPVADSSIFRKGDYFWFDTLGNAERLTVEGIVDGTHITGKVKKNHASGVWVVPVLPLTDFYFQTTSGNSGAMYVFFYPNAYHAADAYGRGSWVPNKTGQILVLSVLQNVSAGIQPYDLSSANNFGGNPGALEYIWVDGTTSDKYNITADQS